MQNNQCRSYFKMLIILWVTAFVFVGCMNEDRSMCITYTHKFRVKALDANNAELDPTKVTDVTLFLFDKDKGFLETKSAVVGESVELYYPDYNKLFVVAWGNHKQGAQTMPVLNKGNSLDAAYVSLIRTRTEVANVKSPNDLFYGYLEMVSNVDKPESILLMQRKVASVAITARTLKEYAGTTGQQGFRYELRAYSSERISYNGIPNGNDVRYLPDAAFDTKDDFVTSAFNIFPTLTAVEVDIYLKDRLLKTITTDAQGRPLRPQEGRLLNILIDFRANVDVSVSVTPWGEKQIWKEFN